MDNFHCVKNLAVFLIILFSVKDSFGEDWKNLTIDWKECGGAGLEMNMNEIKPNPFRLPSNVTFSAIVIVKSPLTNLSVDTIVKKKSPNGTYVEIPCQDSLGGILLGPCKADNYCQRFADFLCDSTVSYIGSRECKCPLQSNLYLIRDYKLGITFDGEIGEYHVRREIKMNGKVIGCTELDMKVF